MMNISVRISENLTKLLICQLSGQFITTTGQAQANSSHFRKNVITLQMLSLYHGSCLCSSYHSALIVPLSFKYLRQTVTLLMPTNEVWGKVIFFSPVCQSFCSQRGVFPSMQWGCTPWADTTQEIPPGQTPLRQTPPNRHPHPQDGN